MTSSACMVLLSETERFIDYIFSNAKIRQSIYDEESFESALALILNSDPSLKNIRDEIRRKGESLQVCGQNIFQSEAIKKIVKTNINRTKSKIRERVKAQHPAWKRGLVSAEVERRIKISLGVSKTRIKKIQSITIEEALKPVRVSGYQRQGKSIKKHVRTEIRKLSSDEERIIVNNIKLPPSEIINKYYAFGLKYRSKESLRKHIYRIRKKMRR